jgi:hypothetical protein
VQSVVYLPVLCICYGLAMLLHRAMARLAQRYFAG